MAVSQADLIRALREAQKSSRRVMNKRCKPKGGRRRVYNEGDNQEGGEEDFDLSSLFGPAPEEGGEGGGDAPADDMGGGDTFAEGSTVEAEIVGAQGDVKPGDLVLAEVKGPIEGDGGATEDDMGDEEAPVEDDMGDEEEAPAEEDMGGDEEEEDDSFKASNNSRYMRVKNARLVRNRRGGFDVVIPKKAVKRNVRNARRYKVTNGSVDGSNDWPGIKVSASKVVWDGDPITGANPVNNLRRMAAKARKYDQLVKNVRNKQILDGIVKHVQRAIVGNACCGSDCADDPNNTLTPTEKKERDKQNSKIVSSLGVKNGRFLNFKNFRRVMNEDGVVSIIVDPNDAEKLEDLDQPLVTIEVSGDGAPAEDIGAAIPAVDEIGGMGDIGAISAALGEDAPETPEEIEETVQNMRRLLVRNARYRNGRTRRASVYNEAGEDKETTESAETVVNNESAVSTTLPDVPSTFPEK